MLTLMKLCGYLSHGEGLLEITLNKIKQTLYNVSYGLATYLLDRYQGEKPIHARMLDYGFYF